MNLNYELKILIKFHSFPFDFQLICTTYSLQSYLNQIQEEDYEEFAKPVLKFGFVTTLLHGATHGDLHGGNILFIKDENDKKHKIWFVLD